MKDATDPRLERVVDLLTDVVARSETAMLALTISHGALIEGLIAHGNLDIEKAIAITLHVERALGDASKKAASPEQMNLIAGLFGERAKELRLRQATPAPRGPTH